MSDLRIDAVAAVESQNAASRISLAPPLGRRQRSLPVGRDDLVAELTKALGGSGKRVHLLHGLGGSGKSAIALEVVHRAGAGLDVWWTNAPDEATLAEHMRAVAHEAGVSDAALLSGDPDALWKRLESRRTAWLLVIDNAEDPSILAGGTGPFQDGCGWVRDYRGSNGMVLILTRSYRRDDWADWCAAHKVDMLSPADALAVLQVHVHVEPAEMDAATRLVERLGRLPLALHLAGAYLAYNRQRQVPDSPAPTTFAGYLAAIDSGEATVRDQRIVTRGRKYLDRPWSMSLPLVRAWAPMAEPLLRLAAGLAPAPIPIGEIFRPAVLAAAGFDADADAVEDALTALGDVHLTEPAPRGTLQLHPMVRDAVRDEFPCAPEHITALVTMLRRCPTVEEAWPDDTSHWPAWTAVAPHAFHLIGILLDADPQAYAPEVTEMACFAANYATRSMHARGLYLPADTELARIERLAVRELGWDHEETLRTRHYRAVVLYARDQLPEALQAFEAVYQARRNLLGDDHGETVRTRHYRAMIHHELGHHELAGSEYAAVLAIRERILADKNHRHTLATRHNLARLQHDRGDLGAAERGYRDVLASQEHTLRGDYRHALATRHNLALCLHVQGRLDEAWTEYQAVLGVEEKLLLSDHPATLATRAGLAMVMLARGRTAEAVQLLDDVYAAQCATLGPTHPETIATRDRQVSRRTRPGPL